MPTVIATAHPYCMAECLRPPKIRLTIMIESTFELFIKACMGYDTNFKAVLLSIIEHV